MRTAQGKTDCAFADFTDTVARLGPIDKITGRMPKQKRALQGAPFKVCPECGSQNATSALRCLDCDHEFPPPDRINHGVASSDAPVLSSQIQNNIVTYAVTDVRYSIHKKPGSPDSLRVDYYAGLKRVASEWVCFEHTGWARAKAEAWWKRRIIGGESWGYPETSHEAQTTISNEITAALQTRDTSYLRVPSTITVNETGKFPEIIRVDFAQHEQAA
jgi:DNA repair protein RadD